ncbi:MAG: PEP-CTERM sorting domain-containing protein, partial [Pirellulaceae bacterium]
YWLYAASTIPTNATNGGVAWRYISPEADIPAGQQGVNNQSRIYNEASNSWGSLVNGRPYIYSITAVPEPTSMALVALAGGAYAWRRRLQKKSKV